MEQAPAALAKTTVDQLAEIGVSGLPDVFHHAYGDKTIVLPIDIAVVGFDEFNAILEAFPGGALTRPADLLTRDVVGTHAHTIFTRHIQRKATPSTTGLDHPFPWHKPQLAADEIELGELRLFQACILAREIGTGIDQFLIQPQFVEIITDIVMMMNIFFCPGVGVGDTAMTSLSGTSRGSSNARRSTWMNDSSYGNNSQVAKRPS